MVMMKSICIIPAYNEESTITDAIRDVIQYVDEVIVIDDGSTDHTSLFAQEAGAIVLSHSHNRGVGAAFSSGALRALENGADIAVTFDADGQFQGTDIPKLIDPITEGRADFVSGSRFIELNSAKEMPFTKRIGNRLFTRIVNRLTGMNSTDTQCGFRAYSREALLRLTTFGRFTYTQEVFLDLASKNMRIMEVPIHVRPRKVGKSKVVRNPIHYGLRALKIIIQFERDFRPLRFFSIVSLFFLLPGLAMLLFVLSNWLLTGMSSPYTSLISIGGILILVSIIFIILALIADMNGRQRILQEEMLYLLRKQYYSEERGGKEK